MYIMPSRTWIGWCAVICAGLEILGCGIEADPRPVAAPEVPVEQAGGGLVSPELFDLAARWSAESLAGGASFAARSSLVDYARATAPELVDEAIRAVGPLQPAPGAVQSAVSPCTCEVWGAFSVASGPSSGRTYSASHAGPAHTAHIYQVESGSRNEDTASMGQHPTQFRTRMNCMTPDGLACAAGCSAKLYADVQYSTTALAEAHTWTIWDKAGTTQVSDGVTLDLRTPNGGAGVRLMEKAVSASQAATSTAFDPNQLATALRSGLGIYTAIRTNTPDLIPDLASTLVKSLFGLISYQGGTDGSNTQQMIATYETYFDGLAPIDMSYSSTIDAVYGLDLTGQTSMKVRGWGYHSETGDLESSYSMAVFVDNFVCGTGVTLPQRTGFWRYDGFNGAPITVASLQQRIASFFSIMMGASVPVTTNQGLIRQGVCGNGTCDGFETPATCAADCGYCGDGTCNRLFENATSCVDDCGYCGDGTCYGSEDASWCPQDCGYCGDGVCYNENALTCPSDCPGYCGDGICSGDDPWNCPGDCNCSGQICQAQ